MDFILLNQLVSFSITALSIVLLLFMMVFASAAQRQLNLENTTESIQLKAQSITQHLDLIPLSNNNPQIDWQQPLKLPDDTYMHLNQHIVAAALSI